MLKLRNPPSKSPNHNGKMTSVEFIVIHYTVESLHSTFDFFLDPARKVSSHFVIADEGDIYELVDCLTGDSNIAWHAGKSSYTDETGKDWNDFNEFSIGIELVNRNGNIFPYTDAQYDSLSSLVSHLGILYPALVSPYRVVGHEQIAGFRGKVDPGIFFDWQRFFQRTFPHADIPHREVACPSEVREVLRNFGEIVPLQADKSDEYWRNMNLLLEVFTRLTNEK